MLVPTPHFSGKEEVTDKNIEDLDNMKGWVKILNIKVYANSD